MNTLRDQIKTLKVLAHKSHFWVDGDNWYSCPLSPDGCDDEGAGTECNCGANTHNERVDKLYELIKDELDKLEITNK